MTDSISILQCSRCERFFDAAGGLLCPQPTMRSHGMFIAQPTVCASADCGAVAAVNEAKLRAKIHADAVRFRERHGKKEKGERSRRQVAGGIRRNAEFGNYRSSCPPERDWPEAGGDESTVAVATAGERQEAFLASGKADSCNDRLLEFFEHVVRAGQLNVWFSRKFLKELCGNDYINNRIVDMRKHFAPKGVKIVNANVAVNEASPAASHYRLMLMSDAEFAEFERSKVPPC